MYTTVMATVFFSSYYMQTSRRRCQVNKGFQSFTALLPVQLILKAEQRKKFYILHLILHLIVSLHNDDMRESRFVFTVIINALCNSLKTIKEAEVFPPFFLLLFL